MKKLSMVLILLVIVAFAGATYVLPSYISNQVSGRITRSLQTEEVQAKVDTTPSFMLLFGHIDNIDIVATNPKIDKVQFNELSVEGQDVEVNVQELLLARRLIIDSAENLTVRGIIDEKNLATLLTEQVDKITDITVSITPNSVEATGKISFFGQEATVHVNGIMVLEGKNVLFRITNVDTSNKLFGKIGISLTKDVFLVSADKLPLEGAKFTRVEQQNGQVLIEAGINK